MPHGLARALNEALFVRQSGALVEDEVDAVGEGHEGDVGLAHLLRAPAVARRLVAQANDLDGGWVQLQDERLEGQGQGMHWGRDWLEELKKGAELFRHLI